MNVLYLLSILDTKEVTVLVDNIDLPLVDIDLALWDAQEKGLIEIDFNKNSIKPLVNDYEISGDGSIQNKILSVMQHYEKEHINVTRGHLNNLFKAPHSDHNYPWHEYLMALQVLIDREQIGQEVVTVPEIKGQRPFHRFVFLTFPHNPNEEWNQREVEQWKKSYENAGKKKRK